MHILNVESNPSAVMRHKLNKSDLCERLAQLCTKGWRTVNKIGIFKLKAFRDRPIYVPRREIKAIMYNFLLVPFCGAVFHLGSCIGPIDRGFRMRNGFKRSGCINKRTRLLWNNTRVLLLYTYKMSIVLSYKLI